jgi:Tol biopolymer transport system component
VKLVLLLVPAMLPIATGERVIPPDLPDNPLNTRLTPWSADTLNLTQIPFKIVHETYRETDGQRNWEIFMMNADGSDPVNLTNTPDVDEMYPHVSPDATKICFVVDEGRRRNRVRHVYIMNIDGSDRVHVAAHAREPCWCFDSKSVAYLTDEYERFSTREYATDALMYYYLENRWTRPHVNTDLHHLYAICWSPDGKWFLSAVSGGMGYSDTIIAFEAFGMKVFDLAKWGVKGCRPDWSADGKHMVWGETDWNLKIADVNTAGPEPQVTNIREILRCSREYKVYHVDLSPDGKWIAFTYGPFRGGQQVGGMAEDWNICVGDLNGRWVQITTNGFHNKEPDWVPIPTPAARLQPDD